jgi:rhodanese-related sulfurtransferase
MIFRRFYEPQLAQTSYLIGCTTTRSAIVVDPNRDVEPIRNGPPGTFPARSTFCSATCSRLLSSLPTNAPIVVHCQGGGRSAIAASLLLAHAHSRVSNLGGGLNEWLRSGHAVQTEPGAVAAPV